MILGAYGDATKPGVTAVHSPELRGSCYHAIMPSCYLGRYCVSKYEYTAQNEDELSFMPSVQIKVPDQYRMLARVLILSGLRGAAAAGVPGWRTRARARVCVCVCVGKLGVVEVLYCSAAR